MSEGHNIWFGWRVLLCCIPLLAFAVLLAVSVENRPAMAACYANASFYIIWVLFILWVFQLTLYLRHLKFSALECFRNHWVGLLLSFGVTIAIFWSVPVYLKILNDETNLLSVSQSMFYYQGANRISMAKFFHDRFHAVAFEVPIRPVLFPFFTYLFHALLGYHYQNVFVLNFVVTFVFLAGVYVCARRFTTPEIACAGLFLVASYPVFSIYGASGGYDLISSFFYYLSMVLLFRHLRSPDAPGFALLWATLLMLANIRSESIVFLPIVMGGAVIATRRFFFRQCLHVYLMTPLLFLPYVWQRLLSVGQYENPTDVPLFSIRSFLDHSGTLLRNFSNLDFFLPYNGILNFAAVATLLYLAGRVASKKLRVTSYQAAFWIIFGACLGVHTIITLSHFMGFYDGPTQARFFLNLSIGCALAPILLAGIYPNRIPAKAFLGAAVVLFLLYHPIASKHDFIGSTLISRSHNQETRFLKHLNDPNLLILSSYSTQFSVLNYSALTMAYANSHREELKREMDDRLYSRIIAFQHIDTRTNTPVSNNQELAPKFVLTPIKSISVFPNVVLRISEVKFDDSGVRELDGREVRGTKADVPP